MDAPPPGSTGALAELAAQAKTSERTLLRRFEIATGKSPKQWLFAERRGRARELLEDSELSVEQVADNCGYVSADTLRHHFRRVLRLAPARYRECFTHGAPLG